jgi:hypothetical protein
VIKNVECAVAGKSRVHLSGKDSGPQAELEAQETVSFCAKIDLGVLILGNLVWGFGDLVGSTIKRILVILHP